MNIDNKQKREPLHIAPAIHPKGGYVARPGEHRDVKQFVRSREGGYVAMPSPAARHGRVKEANKRAKLLLAAPAVL